MSALASDSLTLPWFPSVREPAVREQFTLRVDIDTDVPAWVAPTIARLVELSELPALEVFGGRPMDNEDVAEALNFLARNMQNETVPPWIGLLNSGGIELAWRCGDVEIEAVFDRARNEATVIVEVGGNEWDAPADEADSLVASVVDRLSYSHVAYVNGA